MRKSAEDKSQGRKEAMRNEWAEQETPWPVGVREAAGQQLPGRQSRQGAAWPAGQSEA